MARDLALMPKGRTTQTALDASMSRSTAPKAKLVFGALRPGIHRLPSWGIRLAVKSIRI
jgi:hypothetical protein